MVNLKAIFSRSLSRPTGPSHRKQGSVNFVNPLSVNLGKFWKTTLFQPLGLVAEWIHFAFFRIMSPTIKLKVCTFWGL